MIHRIDEQAFDRYLADWLDDEAGSRAPAYLGETLARIDTVSQRRAWASLERWLPMSVITARPTGTTRNLASVGIALAMTVALIAGLVVVASQVLRDDGPDPRMSALVPTLELDSAWDASSIPGLDEPMVGDIGPDGNLYVVNGGTNEILVIAPDGSLVRRFGESGSEPGQLDFQSWPTDPFGGTSSGSVAVGPDGSVYVADKVNDRVQRFSPDGTFISAWGGYGPEDGRFLDPMGIATAPDGRVYVIDAQRSDIQVFSPEGEYQATIGSRGSEEGQMVNPGRVAIGRDGTLFSADYGNDRLQSWDRDGSFRWAVPAAGPGGIDFSHPDDVEVDDDGNVFVGSTVVQVRGSDGTLRSEWVPPDPPIDLDGTPALGPIFVVAGDDGSVYVSLQLLDTIHKLDVVDLQALASPGPADETPAPSTLPFSSPVASAAAAIETVRFDHFKVPFTLDMPATWTVDDRSLGGVVVGEEQPAGQGGPAWVQAYVVENAFTDPCHPTTSAMDPVLGPSVDALVAALTDLDGFRAGPVADVELDGHPGKVFDLENSLDPSACERAPWLSLWTYERSTGVVEERGPSGDFHEKIYIVDVDGQRVLIESWTFGDTARDNVIEADQVLRSIDFE